MIRAFRVLGLAGVAAIAAIVAMMVWLSHSPGDDVHVPRGYPLIAKLFLKHNWLRLDDQTGRVSLTASAGASVQAIYRETFLEADVEDFNQGARTVFKVENEQLAELDPTRHNILLPFGAAARWRGTLRYRPSHKVAANLRGLGADIELRGLTAPVLEEQSLGEVTLRGDHRSGPAGRVGAEIVNLFGHPRVYLGKVHLAADKIVVNNRAAGAGVSFSIDGQGLVQGNRAWLAPGDVLKLLWPPGVLRPWLYAILWHEGGRSADAISTPCAVNGRWARCPERPSLTLASDVIGALDNAANATSLRGRPDVDVILTLDRELNGNVQAALDQARNHPPGAVDGEQARRTMTRAAVTVMDALNGDVLALASYPTTAAMARVSLADSLENRLLRNHNFSRMPIGSVAKVLLAAAIVDADPRLAGLQLRQHPAAVDRVAGIHIEPSIESHAVRAGGDGLVDFHEFIAHSSNEYAAVLLTMASATRAGRPLPVFTGDPLPTEGRFTIGGQRFERAPAPEAGEIRLNLTRGPGHALVAGTLSNLEGEAWGASFVKLFDVERAVTRPIEPRDASSGDRLVDTRVWTPVLAHFYGRDVPADHPFRALGFERENLALNISYRYRSDLLSLMYGGAAMRFSNPKLCEMFARLVTGRKVERALVMDVVERTGADPRPAARTFPRLDLDPALRGSLLRAMAAVAVDGTADALHATLVKIDARLAARGRALGFFSKTGSPRNSIGVPSGLSRAVNVLIRTGAVALNTQGVLAYRGIPVSDDPDRAAASASLVALRGHAGDLGVLRRHGVSSRQVHDVLVLYNVEPEERRERIFTVRDGKVYGMTGVRELPVTGAVYVFGIGIYDAAARRSPTPLDIDAIGHTPQQAWTVAITIEGQGGSREVAVPFAKILLESVIWPALEGSIP